MSTNPTLQAFLAEYDTRLSISGSSKILCLDDTTTATVTAWCKDAFAHNDQPSITTHKTDTSSTRAWSQPESTFTHIFATLSSDLKTSVKGLKCVHYSLLWKGVAVILPPESGEVAGEKVNFAKLVELGGFEPGKVRAIEVGGGEICFAMKWDLLTA